MITLLVAAGVGGAGAAVTSQWWPAWGGWVIVFAAGVNLVACWLAFVPLVVALRRREDAPRGILAATVIRLFLVSLAAVGAAAAGLWPTKVLALWLVVFYVSLLAVETGRAARLANRRREGTEGSAAV